VSKLACRTVIAHYFFFEHMTSKSVEIFLSAIALHFTNGFLRLILFA